MEEVRYMISEASKRVDKKDHVLRYWEEQLELPIGRTEMGHRYYKDTDIEQMKIIKNLMDQGFQLKAIKLLLPNLHNVELLDDQTMIRLRKELNRKVIDMCPEDARNDEMKETDLIATTNETELKEEEPKDKMEQFKEILSHIVLEALKENNSVLSNDISTNVSDSVIKEMSFLMRLQEEKEEERFRRFDLTLRDYQKSRMMTAATYEGRTKRKSKFLKKNKIHI